MPEILSEVPSEGELREYFDLCFADTALEWLRNPAASFPKPEQHEMVAALESLWPLGSKRFYELTTEALFQTLIRLNNLPRTDPFWYNTNNRPTWSKIPDFCRRLLQTDADDPFALWALGDVNK